MAVAPLVLGIISLIAGLFGFCFVGLPISIVGIVLAVIAKKKAPSGMATAGLVLSIIACVLCAIFFVACVACLGGTAGLAACAA